jgi:hypothetical protein
MGWLQYGWRRGMQNGDGKVQGMHGSIGIGIEAGFNKGKRV